MIKGKFYAGLPSEMINRESTRNVNRQESHFFWPDETDLPSVERRTKRTVTKSAPITTNNNNTDTQFDIKPKELFRKQLSSGIQFYDNVNAKTPESRRRRFKKIDNINLNNNDSDFQPEKKKLETFSSKIEFYDFEHEKNAKNEKPVNIRNMDEMKKDEIKPKNEIKLKNESPEMSKKRISFRTEEKATEKTKGILKNNDEKSAIEKVLVKPLPKRGLLPKNLSKSVGNIPKMAKDIDDVDAAADTKTESLSTIIREVKNMNLSQERNRKNDDYDRGEYSRDSDRIEPRRNNRDYDRYPDKYDSRGYRDEEYRYRNDERNRNRHNERYDDYDDRGDKGYVERRYERNQRVSYSQPKETNEYRDRPRRYEVSPIRGRRSPIHDRHDYSRDYDREPKYERDYEPKRAPVRDLKSAPVRKPIDTYYDEPPKRTVRHDEDEYSTCISRKPKHTPQHLRSNILFNGRVGQQTQRPMSVRNSAVTRVGVGLPDYE